MMVYCTALAVYNINIQWDKAHSKVLRYQCVFTAGSVPSWNPYALGRVLLYLGLCLYVTRVFFQSEVSLCIPEAGSLYSLSLCSNYLIFSLPMPRQREQCFCLCHLVILTLSGSHHTYVYSRGIHPFAVFLYSHHVAASVL